jgi:biopolymer transport protein TolR
MAMAMSQNGGGSGKRRRGRKAAPMAEMNMIPFIDVMLVLLVIFMVAAPLLTIGVPVDLPKTGAGQLNIDQKPIAVTIDEQGRLFLQDRETKIETLAADITAIAKQGYDERIYVRGANRVEYGRVAAVLATLNRAGFTKTALVNQPGDQR